VPDGEPLAGMAHHKIHDHEWTGLPLLPHLDDKIRELHRPSTAATLNLAAAGAQGARLFAPYDAELADELLTAARTAWAAAELYLTTGEQQFADAVTASPHHTGEVFTAAGFSWGEVAALGRMDLATVPNALPDRDRVRESVIAGADAYLATQSSEAYGHPYAPDDGEYVWGSNSQVLNNMVVLGTAYDLTGEGAYRDGVVRGMDYLLGRNALNHSYITGYGKNDARNQHSRWYANQLNPSLPNPPDGSIAGGPNSLENTWDPVAQRLLRGCAPQFCYIDDIESWSTNEITINWNSALSWVASFVADQDDGIDEPALSCAVDYQPNDAPPGALAAQISVTNTGATRIKNWEVSWAFTGAQVVSRASGAKVDQQGATVTVRHGGTLRPGRSDGFSVTGSSGGLASPSPELFRLNGSPCTTR
jgi:endoglucanase